MGTRGVEVAQQGGIPLLRLLLITSLGGIVALRRDKVRNGGLHGELGVTVGVGRAQGALLRDGDHVGEPRRVTVDRRGTREDNVVHIVLLHGAQEVDRAVDVDIPVVQRAFAGFANGLIPVNRMPALFSTLFEHDLPSERQSG